MREQRSEQRGRRDGRKTAHGGRIKSRYKGRKGGEGSRRIDERSAVRKETNMVHLHVFVFRDTDSGTAAVSHSAWKQLFIWQLPGGILSVCVCHRERQVAVLLR